MSAINKLPKSVGVEIEVTGSSSIFSKIAKKAGWEERQDRSCGHEFVSPPITEMPGLTRVDEVCQALKRVASVDVRCGLHVHVGMRDHTDPINFLRLLVWFEKFFFALAPCRAEVTYAKPLTPQILKVLQALSGAGGEGWHLAWDSRYHWINGMAFNAHGTLEFRLMPGTINGFQVSGWMVFLSVLARVVELRPFENPELMVSTASLSFDYAELSGYLRQAVKIPEISQIYHLVERALIWLEARWLDCQDRNIPDAIAVEQVRKDRRQARLKAWQSFDGQFTPKFAPKTI